MNTFPIRLLTGILVLAFSALPAFAIEYPIGKPVAKAGMEVGAVYLQPIIMEPHGDMLATDKADIHLEADIHALATNKNGFAEGEWMPYLVLSFTITKVGSGLTQSGMLMPMVANDGPHYGANVKLMGIGKYKLTFKVAPPSKNPMVPFGRHVDKETGVAPWFDPFTAEYEFVWAGIGKKGAY